jgi:6-phosphofructokinase 2
MPEILTVTVNPTIDLSFTVDHVEPDAKLRASHVRREPGGGGLNVSRAIASLGGASRALWTRGGHAGQVLADLLDDEKLQHVPVDLAGSTRENVVACATGSGRQYRFVLPGPEMTNPEAETIVQTVCHQAPGGGYVVLSGSVPGREHEGIYRRIIEGLDESVRVIVDSSGQALSEALQAGVWMLKPNLAELSDLFGRRIESDEQIVQAARSVIDDGQASVLLVSLGAGGSFLVTDEIQSHIRTPTVPIRSKVGAGDSMVAGMALGLSRDWPVDQAARLATASGAAAVMTPGTELCRRRDAERLYDEISPDGADRL